LKASPYFLYNFIVPNNKRLKAYLYLLTTAVIWGAAGPVIKYTLSGISVIPFLFYRFLISSVISLIILSKNKNLYPPLSKMPLVILYSIFAVSLSLGFLFLGLEKTTMLETVIITTFNPLLITLAGALVFKDRITKKEKLGTAIAFAGTLVAISYPLLNGKNGATLLGNILVFSYLLTNTAGAMLAKKLARDNVSPIFTSNFSFIIGLITTAPFALKEKEMVIQSISALALNFHLSILYMAVLSGNLAYYLWVRGQKTIEISEASLFAYLQPIFSTPLAILWLGEKITPVFIIGAILITTGVIIAETKKGLVASFRQE